jgi:RNase P/RNase MRP subunit POP5
MKRTKRRYLAVQVECERVPSEWDLMDAVWASLTRLYGEVTASLAGLALINFDAEHKLAVIRVGLVVFPQFRASLTSVTSVAGMPAGLHVLAVSGTIKALFAHI